MKYRKYERNYGRFERIRADTSVPTTLLSTRYNNNII